MATLPPTPRFRTLDRSTRSTASLDEQLPPDHTARVVWDFVLHLDLSPLTARVRAVHGHAGAPAWRHDVLFALWLFATTEGLASARELAERCQRDLPYQWLCGGAAINYHTLADFYSDHAELLHTLFVESVAVLCQQQLITLQQVTLDGRKIPAAASKSSAHREGTLQRHLEEATAHLERLQTQRQQAAGTATQQQAAQLRAASERQQRLQAAITQVHARQEQRRQAKRRDCPPADARASETDPDAAKMKLADGSFQLAYNVQTVTDTQHGLIVTVAVTNQGSDNGLLGPLMQQVEQEQGRPPAAVLVDAGFADAADVEQLEQEQVTVYMPPRNAKQDEQAGRDPYAAKRRDSAALADWRARMGTAAAQAVYSRRAPVAEGVHAQQKNRGWRRFRLRGLGGALVEALWQALAHNLSRVLALSQSGASGVRAAVV